MKSYDTNAGEIAKKITEVIRRAKVGVNRTAESSAREIARIMQRAGLPIRYPVDWDSEKQRKAFFATDGFGRGIPYNRTGAYERGWTYSAISNGHQVANIGHNAMFLSGNPSGAPIGVSGKLQSNIHRNRWRLIKPVLDAVLARLPENLLKSIGVEVNR